MYILYTKGYARHTRRFSGTISDSPMHDRTADTILSAADSAMYAVKRAGKSRIVVAVGVK